MCYYRATWDEALKWTSDKCCHPDFRRIMKVVWDQSIGLAVSMFLVLTELSAMVWLLNT